MKIIVTGGAGFIGSHLTDRLISLGHDVLAVDNLSTGHRENVDTQAGFRLLDILQTQELQELFLDYRPDTVFHLAAQTSVGVSMEDPVKDAAVNVMGTLNVLSACLVAGVRKIVFASSAAVYGIPAALPVTEVHDLKPLSPYGLSKKTCEQYIRLLSSYHPFSYSILRYANVYGPRQDSRGEAGVLSIFTDRHLHGRGVSVYGDGSQTRDFIYVKDIVTANIAAMYYKKDITANIGTGTRTSLTDVIRSLENASHPMKVAFAEKRDGDLEHSCLDSRKARSLLAWAPVYSLRDGLAEYWNVLQKERERV